MSKVKNVLVVVADCLRADAVPDRLLGKGAIYSNAWACGSATIPAFASLYTGLLPHEHGHVSKLARPVGPTIEDMLTDHSFYFVTENPFSQWAGKLIQADGAGASWLVDQRMREPWVAFYHSMITHWPYAGKGHEHKHFYKENDPEGVPILTTLYRDGVDKMVSTFLDLERALGPDVSILTADHGDGMMEHGFWGHPAGRMFPPLLHVPLIVRDGVRKYTYSAPFSMANFPQLVLAQAETGKRVRAIPGEECYSAGYRNFHPRVASIRKDNDLVIASAVRKPMIFDLTTDPLAQKPTLAPETTPIMPVLHEVGADVLDVALEESADKALSPEEEAQMHAHLERLGYV